MKILIKYIRMLNSYIKIQIKLTEYFFSKVYQDLGLNMEYNDKNS